MRKGWDIMKLVLSMALVIVSFFACYAENIVYHFFPPLQGSMAPLTFRAQRPFNFDQEKAFGSKRNVALAQYIPIYSYVPERPENARRRIEELSKRFSSVYSQQPKDGSETVRMIKKDFGVELTAEEAARLLQVSSLDRILDAMLTIVESILQGRIVEDPQPIKGKTTAEVLYPPPIGTIAYPANELITVDEAKQNLQRNARQILWQVDEEVLDLLLRITSATVLPNLKYDRKENDRRIEAIVRRYPTVIVPYNAGDVLVSFRKTLKEEDILLLTEHEELSQREALKTAPWILFAIILMVFFHDLLQFRIASPPYLKRTRPSQVLATLMLALIIMRACLLFTSIPIYTLPICILPVLLLLLGFDRCYAAGTAVLGVTLASLFSGRTFEILLFYTFGSMAALISCPQLKKPYHVMIPSAVAGTINLVVLFFIGMDWGFLGNSSGSPQIAQIISAGNSMGDRPLHELPWAFTGGLVAGPLSLLLLPALEWPWNTAASFRLHQYTDLQHPILRDLLAKAPGTYQHTMAVAHLAQAAGEAIGANVLLLRAGAYFHDIGKALEPRFFIENQMGNKNPHDELKPAQSARILFDHVRKGRMLGREAGVPEVILDFIPQHHGTLLAEFFYHKALENHSETPPREEEYRYPGPKPQRIETAVLMICDAVEATSRTLQEPTHENIRKMVWRIIEKRLADGQFSECDLSTRDLATIINVLCKSLEAFLHARLEYPWQKEEQGEEVSRNND